MAKERKVVKQSKPTDEPSGAGQSAASMSAHDWDRFEWSKVLRPAGTPEKGATKKEIKFGEHCTFHIMTDFEVRMVRDSAMNPWQIAHDRDPAGTPEYDAWKPPDASGWVFPPGPFPASYLSLVRWSNGGGYRAGNERILQIVPIDGVRIKMIELHSPKNMSLAVPFAWNDYYDIYCFDMRKPLHGNEYPILVTRGNAMNYTVCRRAAKGLLEFLLLPESPRPPNN